MRADIAMAANERLNTNWNAVSGATSYELQQNRSSLGWTNGAYTGPNTSVMLQRGLGGLYEYRVRACNAGGCSGYSNSHAVYVQATNNLAAPPPEDAL
jgi:hypothetical protein